MIELIVFGLSSAESLIRWKRCYLIMGAVAVCTAVMEVEVSASFTFLAFSMSVFSVVVFMEEVELLILIQLKSQCYIIVFSILVGNLLKI